MSNVISARSSSPVLRVAAVLALVLGIACRRDDPREAEQAVRGYVAKLIEAYRTGDQSLVDPLVGDEHGIKLVGLIGVKQDAGVVLDAKLLDLQFTRVEREGDRWVVETRERWYYADRKIGTGEQVGEDSTDSYAMRYRFARKDRKLILESLEFTQEPLVGRKVAPMVTDTRVLHGLPPLEEAPAPAAAPAPPPRGAPPAGHPPQPQPGHPAPPAPGR